MDNASLNFRMSSFRSHVIVWVLLTTLLCSFFPSLSAAQQPTATIGTVNGTVLVNGQEQGTGAVLSAGDVLETQAGASVVLELSDGSLLEIGENTNINITELTQTATGAHVSLVKLIWGRIRATLSPGHQQEGSSFTIQTPNALVGVKFSQPDVEVSYDPAKQETLALALTVALAVKNLITDEEKLIPIGSLAIITALGIKVMAGAAVATGAMSAGATGTGATSTATTSAAAAEGMGTGTKVAIGAGTLAAAGGIAVLVAGGDESDESDESDEPEISFTGIFVQEWRCYRDMPPCSTGSYDISTLDITQTGTTIDGSFSQFTDLVVCSGVSGPVPISGTVDGRTMILTFPAPPWYPCLDPDGTQLTMVGGGYPAGNNTFILSEDGNILYDEFRNADYIRQ